MRALILFAWIVFLGWVLVGCPEPPPGGRVALPAAVALPVKHACALCKGKCCMKCQDEDKCCCRHLDKCPCPPDSRRP